MKRIALALALGAAALVCGCASQRITERHYYEPTDKTALKREDGMTVGALKTEIIKSGSPDWSDSKSLSLISVDR